MTLQQLKYVVAVADKGTISKASKELFVSQPSLTNAIRELEKEMNISIFNRTNKGTVVSQEGEKFLRYARQVLEQASLLESAFKGNVKQKISNQMHVYAQKRIMEQERNDGDDLHDGLDLAVFVRGNNDALINGHCTQTGHGKLPADDDDGHPCRNPSQFHKHDQDGADEQLVGKGIQKLPEARNHIPLTGDMPVQEIGKRRNPEKHRCEKAGDLPRKIQQENDTTKKSRASVS